MFFDMKKKGREFGKKLTKRIVYSSSEQQSLQENSIFPDVYLKGRGSPSSDGLDEVGRDTVFCK